jgi:acyl carrier protein
MSRDEIHSKLTDFLEELFEVPREKVTLDARLYEDLDLDSLDAVDLVVQVQGLIGGRVQPGEFKAVRSVRDVIDCIEKLLVVVETKKA